MENMHWTASGIVPAHPVVIGHVAANIIARGDHSSDRLEEGVFETTLDVDTIAHYLYKSLGGNMRFSRAKSNSGISYR